MIKKVLISMFEIKNAPMMLPINYEAYIKAQKVLLNNPLFVSEAQIEA